MDLESSSIECFSDCDERAYSSSDSDDDIVLPATSRSDHCVKFTVEDRENPVEYFENYFDEEIIAYLVTKTNRFSHQFQNENGEALSP